MTPVHCSDALWAWIGDLTTGDRERLWLWGISFRFLGITDVEVSWHIVCAATRFWKLTHHVFHFGKVEMTPTLEEVHWIYVLSRLLRLVVFVWHDDYAIVLHQLIGLTMVVDTSF